MILWKVVKILTCFENNVNASLHNRTEALKVYQSKLTTFLICQIKSNDLSAAIWRVFSKIKFADLFLFCILQQLTCETSPKIQTKRGKNSWKKFKTKKLAQERTKKLAWPALGSPKTLAQMPEGYAFALLITQWKFFHKITQ